jgi:hypothetical protein
VKAVEHPPEPKVGAPVLDPNAADRADQPFNERMRNRCVRNRFDLIDCEDAQVSQPPVEAEYSGS